MSILSDIRENRRTVQIHDGAADKQRRLELVDLYSRKRISAQRYKNNKSPYRKQGLYLIK